MPIVNACNRLLHVRGQGCVRVSGMVTWPVSWITESQLACHTPRLVWSPLALLLLVLLGSVVHHGVLVHRSWFCCIHVIDSIIYSFNDDKSLILKPYTKNESDILYQINKYNEINDIIKTLEVMN